MNVIIFLVVIMHKILALLSVVLFTSSFVEAFKNVSELEKGINTYAGAVATLTQAQCVDMIKHINGEVFELKKFSTGDPKIETHTNLILKATALLAVACNKDGIDKEVLLDQIYSPSENAKGFNEAKKKDIQIHRSIIGFLVDRLSDPYDQYGNSSSASSFKLTHYLDLSIAEANEVENKILGKYSSKFYQVLNDIEDRNKGNSAVQLTGSIRTYMGHGLTKNKEKAFEMLKKASNAGNSKASVTLGHFIRNEEIKGTSAEELYKKAAELGNAEGLELLGQIEMDRKNPTKALMLYEKAANLGSTKALVLMGNIFEFSSADDIVKTDISKAKVYYKKAADNGNPLGMYFFGETLEEEKKFNEAIEWYKKAAIRGYTESMRKLWGIYSTKGDLYNHEESKKWFKKLKDLGDEPLDEEDLDAQIAELEAELGDGSVD